MKESPCNPYTGTAKEIFIVLFCFQASESKALLSLGDTALSRVLILLQVHTVVAIGKFAEKRACIAVKNVGLKDIRVNNASELKSIHILLN